MRVLAKAFWVTFGWLLLPIGVVLLVSPIPFGFLLVAGAVAILFANSSMARRMVMSVRHRFPQPLRHLRSALKIRRYWRVRPPKLLKRKLRDRGAMDGRVRANGDGRITPSS